MESKEATPISAADVCDALGRKAISSAVGRGLTAVSNAAAEGIFPASWYPIIKQMCSDAGIDCPMSLFKFVRQATEPQGDAA